MAWWEDVIDPTGIRKIKNGQDFVEEAVDPFDIVGGIGENGAMKRFGQKLGFGKTDEQRAAERELAEAKAQWEGYEPPVLSKMNPAYAESFDQGDSAFGDIRTDPQYRQVQMDQIAALRNLANNGGRNAATDANLEMIKARENSNARGNIEAILQNAAASGRGGAGANLVAQLNAAQNAQNNQSMQDLQVLGMQQNNALSAGNAAAGIGSNLENQDYAQQANKARAMDAIRNFNASQRTGVSAMNAGINNASQQFNTGLEQTMGQNDFQRRAAKAGQNMAGVNYNTMVNSQGIQQAGNILGGGVKVGTAVAGGGGGGGGGYSLTDGGANQPDDDREYKLQALRGLRNRGIQRG